MKSSFKPTVRLILEMAKRSRLFFVVLVAGIPLTLVLSFLEAYIPKQVVEIPEAAVFKQALWSLVLLVLLTILLQNLRVLQVHWQGVLARQLRLRFMREIFSAALESPYQTAFLEGGNSQLAEGLTAVSTEDCVLTQAPAAGIGALSSVVTLIFFVGVITVIHPILLAVILAAGLLQWLYARRMTKFRQVMNTVRHEGETAFRYYRRLALDEQAAKDLRLFQLNPFVRARLQAALAEINRAYRALSVRNLGLASLNVAMTFVRDYLAYLLLIAQFVRGQIDLPQLVFLLGLIRMTSALADQLIAQLSDLYAQSAAAQQLVALYDLLKPHQAEASAQAQQAVEALFEPSITFDHVSFRYSETGPWVLKDISFELAPGQRMALVGANGAGKSTLIALLLGLLKPTQGQILIGGKPLQMMSDAQRRTYFSTVFQSAELQPVRILDFVTGSLNPDEQDRERVEAILQRVDLAHRVEQEQNGIETYLMPAYTGEGINLSGGETQRLVLASVLYQSAPIVLLDEPTAALDPLAEKRLYEIYGRELKHRTSIFISHRLGSTAFCDKIFFLENGQLVEQGTHAELLQQAGAYAKLYQTQAQYYQEEGAHEAVKA